MTFQTNMKRKTMTDSNYIYELEIKLAHVERQLDELNEVVVGHADKIDRLERHVALLVDRAAEAETDGTVVVGDQRPPHY